MTESVDPWSATRLDVHERLRDLRTAGGGAVATVVDVDGSAYRRPGAKLVVGDDESMGAITAGCIEGPLLDLATDVAAEGTAQVETFDLTDDNEWGIGLGCNGVIDILVEPLDDSLDVALAEVGAKRPVAVLTAVGASGDEVPVGSRVTITADGTVHTPDDRPSLPDSVVAELRETAREARAEGSSLVTQVEYAGGSVSVFVHGVEPVHDLVLFGNQNDIHPVTKLARQAGFRVVVASARGAKSSESAFPNAHDVRSVRAPDLAAVVEDGADQYTAVVLMSHNFIDDRLALQSVLSETDVPYIGLMGPRKRFRELRDELSEEGFDLRPEDLDRIATPVGLDLGGGEPVEIAMSIVGEVLAVRNRRSGGRLREREGPIHSRIDTQQ